MAECPSDTLSRQKVEDAIECGICYGRLTNPKNLPCIHSFCKQCLDGIIKFNEDGSAVVLCPYRCTDGKAIISEFETTDILPNNYVLRGILELLEPCVESICEEKSCSNIVRQLCIGCKGKHCSNCHKKHRCEGKNRIFISYEKNNYKILCRQHEAIAKYVCIGCNDEIICEYCTNRDHKGHKKETLQERGQFIRNTLQTELNKGQKYYEKHKFSYEGQITKMQEFGVIFEKELKARMFIDVASYLKQLQNKHDKQMGQYYKAVSDHYKHLDENEKIDQTMSTIVKSRKLMLDTLEDHEIIIAKAKLMDKVNELNTVRCFSASLKDHGSDADKLDIFFSDVHISTDQEFKTFSTHISRTNINKLEPPLKLINKFMKDNEIISDEPEVKLQLQPELQSQLKLLPQPINSTINNEEIHDSGLYSQPVLKPSVRSFMREIERHNMDRIGLTVENYRDLVFQNASKFLHAATENDNLDAIKFILDVNPAIINENNPDNNDCSALHEACFKGFHGCVDYLLKAGANTEAKNLYGSTPLAQAVCNNKIEVVEILILSGANTTTPGIHGFTPLMSASLYGQTEIARILLEHHPDVNRKEKKGWTALMFAARNGHKEIVALLLQKNAELNHPNNDGSTALVLAAGWGHKEIMTLLLQNKAEMNHANNGGWTALMLATKNGHLETVRLLLDNKVEINITDNEGMTALMLATADNKYKIVKLLLRYNADKTIYSNELKQANDYATTRKMKKITGSNIMARIATYVKTI